MTNQHLGNASDPVTTGMAWKSSDIGPNPEVLFRVGDLTRPTPADPPPPAGQPIVTIHAVTDGPPSNTIPRNATPPKPTTPAGPPVYTAPRLESGPQRATVAMASTTTPAMAPALSPTMSSAITPTMAQSMTPPMAAMTPQPVTPPPVVPPASAGQPSDSTVASAPSPWRAATRFNPPNLSASAPAGSVQHGALKFLSSVLLSSRRRQLMTFSLIASTLLGLVYVSSPPSTGDSADSRSEGTPAPARRRVTEDVREATESEWAAGVPADALRASGVPTAEVAATASSSADVADWANAPIAPPPAAVAAPDEAVASSEPVTTPHVEIDLSGFDYPETDPANYQYPSNAHELIISMLARDGAPQSTRANQ